MMWYKLGLLGRKDTNFLCESHPTKIFHVHQNNKYKNE